MHVIFFFVFCFVLYAVWFTTPHPPTWSECAVCAVRWPYMYTKNFGVSQTQPSGRPRTNYHARLAIRWTHHWSLWAFGVFGVLPHIWRCKTHNLFTVRIRRGTCPCDTSWCADAIDRCQTTDCADCVCSIYILCALVEFVEGLQGALHHARVM